MMAPKIYHLILYTNSSHARLLYNQPIFLWLVTMV